MGNPLRLMYGFDYRGELCGVGELKGFEYTVVLQPNVSQAATCLDGCPIVATANSMCLYDAEHEEEVLAVPCFDSYTAKGFYNRYCLPSDSGYREAVEPVMASPSFTLTHLLGDIERGWEMVAAGVVVSLGTATLGLICMQVRILRMAVSFFSFGMCLLLSLSFVFFTYEEIIRVEEHYCDDFGPVIMQNCEVPNSAHFVSYFSALVVCALAVLIIYQVPKLCKGHLALRLGMMSLADVPKLLLVPLIGFTLNLAVIVVTLSAVLHLSSCAEIIETDDNLLLGGLRRELVFGKWQRPACLFLLLVGAWWISLVAFWIEFLAASLCQSWYFAKDRSVLKPSLLQAVKHALVHTGSLAYAAVMLPIFLLPRNFLTGMKSVVKRLSYNRASCYIKTCRLCLKVYEKSLKFKVEHCIAHQALWGDTFEVACRRAFYLVKRSESQPKELLSASHFSIWQFELCILLSSPVFVYFWVLHSSSTFSGEPTKFITSGVWLAFVAGVSSWSVAAVVRGYLRGCVHGVVVAYLCEKEMFKGLQRGENYEITRLIEDFAAVNEGEVAPEESLRNVGFDLKGKFSKKHRKVSRVAMLEDDFTHPTKGLESEIDDDLNRTTINFPVPVSEEIIIKATTHIKPAAAKHSEPLDKTRATATAKHNEPLEKTRDAEGSLVIDDARPFGSRGATRGDEVVDDIGEVPDFAPVSSQSISRPKQSLRQYLKQVQAASKPEAPKPSKSRGSRLVRHL